MKFTIEELINYLQTFDPANHCTLMTRYSGVGIWNETIGRWITNEWDDKLPSVKTDTIMKERIIKVLMEESLTRYTLFDRVRSDKLGESFGAALTQLIEENRVVAIAFDKEIYYCYNHSRHSD